MRGLLQNLRPGVLSWILILVLAAACGATVRNRVDDASITARVRAVLLNDPEVSAAGITVSTTNGVVTMSGVVRSAAEEARAIQLARGVAGVREVRSALQVQ